MSKIDKFNMLVTATVSNDKVEYIDVSLEGDRLSCAELCGGLPLLFSHKHGVLALTQHGQPAAAEPSVPLLHAWFIVARLDRTLMINYVFRSICESPMGSPCPSDMYDGNLSLYEIDPHEVSPNQRCRVHNIHDIHKCHNCNISFAR